MKDKLPFNIGDVIPEVRIERLTNQGYGIARLDGLIAFIENAASGDVANIRVIEQKKGYLKCEIESLTIPSLDRIKPPCPYYADCGGCQWQHISYPAQLEAKRQIVCETLIRIAKIEPPREVEIIPCSNPYGYRRRLFFNARLGENELFIGMLQKHSHKIVPIDSCLLAHEEINNWLTEIKKCLCDMPDKDNLCRIETRLCGNNKIIVHFVLKRYGNAIGFIESNVTKLENIQGIYISYPKSKGISIGKTYDIENISKYGLTLQISATSFHQTNSELNEILIDKALLLAAPSKKDTVLDLFCGAGNFSLPMATKAGKVIGVDFDGSAIKDAQNNMQINKLNNIQFKVQDLSGSFKNNFIANIVILDPPRTGALHILPDIVAMKPEKIIYVSCDSASFARDSKLLVDANFRLESLSILDFFPQTYHTETAALFRME